jgi:hypothetical protein
MMDANRAQMELESTRLRSQLTTFQVLKKLSFLFPMKIHFRLNLKLFE